MVPLGDGGEAVGVAGTGIVADAGSGGGKGRKARVEAEARRVGGGRVGGNGGRHTGAVGIVEVAAGGCAGGQLGAIGKGHEGGDGRLSSCGLVRRRIARKRESREA